jgi:hypothetical protein
LPDATDVAPALAQDPPALTAALAGIMPIDKENESIDTNAITLFSIY